MLIFWIWKVALIWQVFPTLSWSSRYYILISFIWESELLVMTFSHMISLSSCSSFAKHQYYFSTIDFYSQDIQKCPTISRVFLNEEKLALLGLHTISKSRILSKNSTLTNLYFWGIFEFLAPNLEYLTKYFIDFLWKNHHFLQTKKKKRKEKKRKEKKKKRKKRKFKKKQ